MKSSFPRAIVCLCMMLAAADAGALTPSNEHAAALAAYRAAVRHQFVAQFWRVESECPAWASATLRVSIDAAGTVTHVDLLRASGFTFCDRAVRTLTERLSPLPAPPAPIRNDALHGGLILHFYNNNFR